MMPMKYKYGIRVERTYSLWFGVGIAYTHEKCLIISLGWCEISVGKVYDHSS